MIVIRRRPGEKIWLGPSISIEILSLSPSRVKLGVTAPADVTVVRGEVLEAATENRLAAASVKADDISRLAEVLRGFRQIA